MSSQDNHSDWNENNDFNGRQSFDRLAMLDVQDMSATLDGMDMTFSYGDSNGNPVTVSIYDGDVEEKNISCVSSSSSGINSTIIVTRKNCASSKDENMAAASYTTQLRR